MKKLSPLCRPGKEGKPPKEGVVALYHNPESCWNGSTVVVERAMQNSHSVEVKVHGFPTTLWVLRSQLFKVPKEV